MHKVTSDLAIIDKNRLRQLRIRKTDKNVAKLASSNKESRLPGLRKTNKNAAKLATSNQESRLPRLHFIRRRAPFAADAGPGVTSAHTKPGEVCIDAFGRECVVELRDAEDPSVLEPGQDQSS